MSESRTSSTARVVVGVSGSPGSLAALGRAAEEARYRGTELWPVLAWEPPGGDFAIRGTTESAFVPEELEQLARDRLLKALGDVFAGTGLRLPGRALVARGAPGRALVQIADRENDLLVIGAGQHSRLHRALWPSVSRYCLAHAVCPVLAVPPPALESALTARHRRNTWRLRLDSGHVEREFSAAPPDA
ncbi:universal stress protein [Streptomyces sp. NA04227]|uniref:universal stress protein n=1 Tax=Streptomyces sp. NA04227 TaxID=2742136 RepID=UPI001591D49B|nr:universal stress protein [Streptomyces sp. NA04227]QKW05068.1 universal stress protein [Streptomyces sp. NA04227]